MLGYVALDGEMNLRFHILLVFAAAVAAVGQVLFRVGAMGRTAISEFVNWPIVLGLCCYGVGMLAWIMALSRLELKQAYPYTVLTFVFVYAMAVGFLGERLTAKAVLGVIAVLVGLYLVSDSSR